jgi:hypothetical protein
VGVTGGETPVHFTQAEFDKLDLAEDTELLALGLKTRLAHSAE